MISTKRQTTLIIKLVAAVAGGSGVDLLLPNLDGEEHFISGSEGQAINDVPLEPIGYCIPGDLHLLGANAYPRLRERFGASSYRRSG